MSAEPHEVVRSPGSSVRRCVWHHIAVSHSSPSESLSAPAGSGSHPSEASAGGKMAVAQVSTVYSKYRTCEKGIMLMNMNDE